MPSYALSNKYKPLLPPPPSAHGGGEGTESTEGVGSQEPPSASNAVGGATDTTLQYIASAFNSLS
jgi:hypothetical protein